MSKKSAAKTARRRKRQAKRAIGVPEGDDLTLIDSELTERGWLFDVDNSTDELATWFYPPSGVDAVPDGVESVTRIWLTADDEWHVILVGAGEDGIDYLFSAFALLEQLGTIEAYRLGGPAPDFEA
ncbi:hypothetical protein ACN27E_14970 [Mycobacterium sp. WMMD1722]|uniref:hypothetical protein n=1 Tax=Mycobacterium sp. WMMD1722 TaxID=3404117 RepID=UPI003BF474A4